MKLVGQEKLQQKLNSFTLQTLPKTMMFLGPRGCGKKTFARELAKRLGMSFVMVNKDFVVNDLLDYSLCLVETLYLIDISQFNEKAQHQFLKFIEEPSKLAYVVVISNSEVGVLPTILNRCTKYRFAPYSEAELKEFTWQVGSIDPKIFGICKTPGQLTEMDMTKYNQLYSLCENIVKNADKAPYANVIGISTRINYKENYNKFDFNNFIDTLEYVAFQDFIATNNKKSFDIYMVVNKAKQDMINKVIAKEAYTIRLLANIWKVVR